MLERLTHIPICIDYDEARLMAFDQKRQKGGGRGQKVYFDAFSFSLLAIDSEQGFQALCKFLIGWLPFRKSLSPLLDGTFCLLQLIPGVVELPKRPISKGFNIQKPKSKIQNSIDFSQHLHRSYLLSSLSGYTRAAVNVGADEVYNAAFRRSFVDGLDAIAGMATA